MKNIMFLTVSSFIEKFASFILYSLLAYNFGKESLGYFSYYFVIANILYLLLDFGGNIYEVKFFTNESYKDNVLNVFFVKIFAYSVLAPFIFFFISDIFFIILFCSFFLESIFTVIKSGFFCNKQFLKFSYYIIIEKLSLILLAVIGTFAIRSLLVFYLALLISKIIVLFTILLSRTDTKILPLMDKLSLKKMRLFVADSWSYTFYSFFALVYGRVGVIIMKHMSANSLEDIGVYSSYANIIMATLIIPEIFFKNYYPSITKDFSENNTGSMFEKISSVLKISFISSFAVTLLIALFSKEISGVLFGPDFVESSFFLSILTIKIAFRFSLRPYLAVVASSNFTRFRFYISFFIFFFSIGINFALIPFFRLNGLIGAALLVELVLFLSYRIFCQKNILNKNFLKHDLLLILLILLIGLTSFFVYDFSFISRIIILIPIILLTLWMLLKEKNNFIFRKEL